MPQQINCVIKIPQPNSSNWAKNGNAFGDGFSVVLLKSRDSSAKCCRLGGEISLRSFHSNNAY